MTIHFCTNTGGCTKDNTFGCCLRLASLSLHFHLHTNLSLGMSNQSYAAGETLPFLEILQVIWLFHSQQFGYLISFSIQINHIKKWHQALSTTQPTISHATLTKQMLVTIKSQAKVLTEAKLTIKL